MKTNALVEVSKQEAREAEKSGESVWCKRCNKRTQTSERTTPAIFDEMTTSCMCADPHYALIE